MKWKPAEKEKLIKWNRKTVLGKWNRKTAKIERRNFSTADTICREIFNFFFLRIHFLESNQNRKRAAKQTLRKEGRKKCEWSGVMCVYWGLKESCIDLSEELRVGGNGNEENGERAKKKKGKVGEAPPSVLAVFYYPFTVLMLKFSLHLSLPPPPLGSHLTIPPSFQFPFSPNFLFLKFYSKVKKKKR